MSTMRKTIFATLALGCLALGPTTASAAPMADPSLTQNARSGDAPAGIEQARYVCGPAGCFWRPGPRRWHRGYGWRRPYWHRGYGWRHPGWHRGYGWRHHGWHRGW